MGGQTILIDRRQRELAEGGELEQEGGESEVGVRFRFNLPSCAVPTRNDIAVAAYFRRAGQGLKWTPPPGGECVCRLVERTGGG
jgi:hypothetical protein